MADETPLDAGGFGPWLTSMRRALAGVADSDVPCAGCTACCRSSQFVHVEPDEADTLAHIPPELLVPAPRLPPGHVLMGYDEHGRCPMLGDDGCTIYEHRPRTCRMYDCRVFAATGVEVDGEEKVAIRERVSRWRFRTTAADDVVHTALRAAGAFLRDHPEVLPDGAAPAGATQLAVLAVDAHTAFLGRDEAGRPVVVTPGADAVRQELAG